MENTTKAMAGINLEKEMLENEKGMAISLPDATLPLDITIRAMSLNIAQKHCGDTVIREGNLYHALKADGKVAGPLTPDHVVNVALYFEAYLWGKFSQDIAAEVIEKTVEDAGEIMEEVMDAVQEKRDNKRTEKGNTKKSQEKPK